jgi:hypothetical protein
MKKNLKMLIFFAVAVLELNSQALGFNSDSHANLTQSAIFNSALSEYLQNQLNIQQGLGEILTLDQSVIPLLERIPSDQFEDRISSVVPSNPTIMDLLESGSRLEDIPNPRAKHHFYDPYRNTGLENKTEHPDLALAFSTVTYVRYWGDNNFDLTGASNLNRALNTEEAIWEQEYRNYFAWPDARSYFYKALTQESKSAREHYLALTFLSFGHVMHLLEDLGVPPHARNDFIEAHFRGLYLGGIGNPFEEHVEDEIGPSGIPERWLDGWTPQAKVFPKVASYWDVGDYTGQYVGTSPLSTWGLSEQTNYQFLSKSTIFRENNGTKYYFPHPDVNNVTEHIDTEVYLWGLVPVDYRYISGYDITHLARTKFIQKYAYMAGMLYPAEIVAYHTTFDEAVYEDYAKVIIPRTIDYATGLANYFFRGRLSVEPNLADPNIAVLTITNDSNNSGVPQVLKGGDFKLYWDDTDGNRAEVNDFAVSGWGTESVLDYDDTVTATFTREANAAVYILVYQGQICENPSEPDPCDPNAIAVAVFRPGYGIIAWGGHDNYGQISNVPDGNEFVAVAAGNGHCIALRSDGSLAGWGYNVHNECNVPAGNDYVAISAGYNHSIALKSDGSIVVWGRDNLQQITGKPDGNDFVAIAAGDWHSLAIRNDGTIVGWGGWNTYNECNAPPPDVGTIYTDIAAGTYHSLALQSDGVVKAWGNNNQGQTRIYEGAAGKVHNGVAAGGNYSFLLRDDDVLISWGGGDWISPGVPRYHYRYADGNDFTVIAAGSDHIMALTSDGKVFDWDWPVGTPGFDSFSRPVPPDVVFTEDIDGGYDFSAALRLP